MTSRRSEAAVWNAAPRSIVRTLFAFAALLSSIDARAGIVLGPAQEEGSRATAPQGWVESADGRWTFTIPKDRKEADDQYVADTRIVLDEAHGVIRCYTGSLSRGARAREVLIDGRLGELRPIEEVHEFGSSALGIDALMQKLQEHGLPDVPFGRKFGAAHKALEDLIKWKEARGDKSRKSDPIARPADPAKRAIGDLWPAQQAIEEDEQLLSDLEKEQERLGAKLSELREARRGGADVASEIAKYEGFFEANSADISDLRKETGKDERKLQAAVEEALRQTRPKDVSPAAWRSYVGTPEETENPRGTVEPWAVHLSRMVRRWEGGLDRDGRELRAKEDESDAP
jgi:hypothetical protein